MDVFLFALTFYLTQYITLCFQENTGNYCPEGDRPEGTQGKAWGPSRAVSRVLIFIICFLCLHCEHQLINKAQRNTKNKKSGFSWLKLSIGMPPGRVTLRTKMSSNYCVTVTKRFLISQVAGLMFSLKQQRQTCNNYF